MLGTKTSWSNDDRILSYSYIHYCIEKRADNIYVYDTHILITIMLCVYKLFDELNRFY